MAHSLSRVVEWVLTRWSGGWCPARCGIGIGSGWVVVVVVVVVGTSTFLCSAVLVGSVDML
jgi:hypothetical protein